MFKKADCIALQEKIATILTTLDSNDTHARTTLDREYKPYLELNLQYFSEEDLSPDQKVTYLKQILDKTLDTFQDDLPFGLNESYNALYDPEDACLNLPRDQNNHRLILIENHNITALIQLYGKITVLQAINELTYPEANQPPIADNDPIHRWIDETAKKYQILLVSIERIFIQPQNQYTVPSPLTHIWPKEVMKHFALGRLWLGQPERDINYVANRNMLVTLGFWLVSSLQLPVHRYLILNSYHNLINSLQGCWDIVTERRPFSELPKATALLASNFFVMLILPTLLVGSTFLGLTSIPVNLLRSIAYQYRLNSNFLKALDVLDAIKDIVLFAAFIAPSLMLTFKFMPLHSILLSSVGNIGATLLSIFPILGDLYRYPYLPMWSQIIQSSRLVQGLFALPAQLFLYAGTFTLVGRALHASFQHAREALLGPPRLTQTERENRIRRITGWASDNFINLSEEQQNDIARCLNGLQSRRPTQAIVALSQRFLNNAASAEAENNHHETGLNLNTLFGNLIFLGRQQGQIHLPPMQHAEIDLDAIMRRMAASLYQNRH
jgi:hypothetical protein